MENITLNVEKVLGFVDKEKLAAYAPKVKECMETLEKGTGLGNDFLGWLHLPSSITKEHLADLKATAEVLRENCEVVVVAGIGGSYLGARAVIEAMSDSFQWLREKKAGQPTIIFAGHNIGEDYLAELTDFLKDKKFGVINISKSGTTTETAIAFRLLKKQCEDQRGSPRNSRQGRIQVIHHPRQCGRTLLRSHSGRSAAHRCSRRRHRATGSRSLRDGESMRQRGTDRKSGGSLCCHPQRAVQGRKED